MASDLKAPSRSKVVAVVGARLSSSRLPRKHLLELEGVPLIEHVMRRLATINELDKIVLATTADSENDDLETWATTSGRHIHRYAGDVNNLMGRIDSVVRAEDAELIVYVCGDSPLIEPRTIASMIRGLKANPAADMAGLIAPPAGKSWVHAGFDVYRRRFWDEMLAASSTPQELEHVGSVYRTSQKVAPRGTHLIIDKPIFHSLQHRMSVDTPHDYLFMEQIYREWFAQHQSETVVDLQWVLKQLENRPKLRAINANVHQRRVEETPLNIRLFAQAGPSIGMGHLTRICVAALSLQEHLGAKLHVYVAGTPIKNRLLNLLPHTWLSELPAAHSALYQDCDMLVFDTKDPLGAAAELKACERRPKLMAIDPDHNEAENFDHVWMPSIYVPPELQTLLGNRVSFGEDCFLLKPSFVRHQGARRSGETHIIVLTGGADPLKLNSTLPDELLSHLPENCHITVVRGPYADQPRHSQGKVADQRFHVLENQENLPALLVDYDVALCLYGVTFFECLQAQIPTVVFDQLNAAIAPEWQLVKSWLPECTADSRQQALAYLAAMITKGSAHDAGMKSLAENIKHGPQHFAEKLAEICAAGDLIDA